MDTSSQEMQKWENALRNAATPPLLFEKIKSQLERMKINDDLSQWEPFSRYIEWVVSLPWSRVTKDILDLNQAKAIMDKNHHGLTAIKKRILEYIALLIIEKQREDVSAFHGPTLLLVGLAGTGKSTLAQSIAQSLGRAFVRIPFGGLSSAFDLRGLSRVQPEAEPGLIIKGLRQARSKNSVILLDEIDRVAPEGRSAIMGVLVELLDPEQNQHFTDHYLDYPFDLSRALFIATANTTNNIATAVMDRLEVIQMPSYTDEEKVMIAKNYLLPRLLKESGLSPEHIVIDDAVFKKIARSAGFEPGIRSVERAVETLIRKVAYKIVNKEGDHFSISEDNAKEYLD